MLSSTIVPSLGRLGTFVAGMRHLMYGCWRTKRCDKKNHRELSQEVVEGRGDRAVSGIQSQCDVVEVFQLLTCPAMEQTFPEPGSRSPHDPI